MAFGGAPMRKLLLSTALILILITAPAFAATTTSQPASAQWAFTRADQHPDHGQHHSGLMHLKVSIIDDQTVTTGSYNYSEDASTRNDEVLVVLRDPTMAKAWEAEFNAMWK